MDFDNASFIIDCFTYILFNLSPFFLERKFDNEYDTECLRMAYLVPNEFYIFICKHDNFNVLNKLSLKYQNVSEIVNDFIIENNEKIRWLLILPNAATKMSKKIYILFCGMLIKKEVMETSEVLQMRQLQLPPLSTPTLEAEIKKCKPPKNRKWKCECESITKIAVKKKKRDEKKAGLVNELETNYSHLKHINSNICQKISKEIE